MIQTLSKSQEDGIINAVKHAIELVDDDGLSPDAALEKVARAADWGQDMIRFAVSAYNTGRQTAQFNMADTAQEKFAEFPLADPAVIISSIWPHQVKSAAELNLTGVSAEYASPPDFLKQRDLRAGFAALNVKTAAVLSAAQPVMTFSLAKAGEQRLKAAAETSRFKASAAYDQLMGSLSRLTEYFTTKTAMDRQSFAEVEVGAAAHYGHRGQRLMDLIYDRARSKEARAASCKFASVVRWDPAVAPGNLVTRCLDCAKDVRQKRAQEHQAVAELETYVRTVLAPYVATPVVKISWDIVNGTQRQVAYTDESLRGLLRPAVKVAAAPACEQPAEWSLLSSKSAEGGLLGLGAIASSTNDMMKRHIDIKDPDAPVNAAVADLEDPAHDTELRTIRTQAMLADLMNDPVIGEHDPNTVLNTYNELAQLAPRTAQQPAAMRAALRRHLQGNVQPFESQELLNTEKGLKDTRIEPPPITGTRPTLPSARITKDADSIFI